MSQNGSNLIIFTGEFRHGLDPKNRITIPSAWRSDEGVELYLRVHSSKSHIVAWTRGQLDKMVANIEARTDLDAGKKQKMIRMTTSDLLMCSVDKQGRMVLPPEFCSKAELRDEVKLVGAYGQFEIWNAERWMAQQASESAENQDLANQLGL